MNKCKYILKPGKPIFLIGIMYLMLLSSCSLTKRLGEGEVFYNGVKDINIEHTDGVRLRKKHKQAIKEPLSVSRQFPLGVWIYNWGWDEGGAIGRWIHKRFASKPVLISDIKPEVRLTMAENNLKDLGIFQVRSEYEIIPARRNPKKAKITYTVEVQQSPYKYNSIDFWEWPSEIDSIVRRTQRMSYLEVGDDYDINIMETERRRISNILRTRGYYYFSENYIEYLVDTNRLDGTLDVRVTTKEGIPEVALRRFHINEVNVSLGVQDSTQKRDTVIHDGIKIDYIPPTELKFPVIARAIKMRPGQRYNMRVQERSRRNFIQLGVFRSTNFTATRPDTSNFRDLNFRVAADFGLPVQTEVEVDVASKSNNMLGPGVTLSITHRNFRKRAEIFSMRLNGSYEWQVGGARNVNKSGLINSYELGLNFNWSFPRLVLPDFIYNEQDMQEHTTIQVGTDFLNRNGFFRMLSLWGSMTYDFNKTRRHLHSVTPVRINYTHLLRTSEEFDSTLNHNESIAMSFRDQFIPSMSYTYSYSRGGTYRRPNRLNWSTTVSQAGNLSSLMFLAFGKKGEDKKILGNVYSQFLKLTTEVIKNNQWNSNTSLVWRLMGGIGYAYGNTRVMPYSEQFYTGGSNSIRAFQIRGVGPGSYHPGDSVDRVRAYIDQTGDIKLEANIEYRFTFSGNLKGAVFLDAGNIWLLRDDPRRPGGTFKFKNVPEELALGTGFGVRYDISYLAVRVDLGVALHAPYQTRRSGYFNIHKYDFNDGLVLNIAIGYPF